jgi:tetraacyldisaccharide 4'-kinase
MSPASGLRRLLLPLTPLYRLGLAQRERRLASGREPIQRLQFPVISIGNLSTGGAGKTPLVIALTQALKHRGFAVDVLSRGYGRSATSAARVDPNGTAEEFGDEPLLIARQAGAPVFVARQRYDAGLLAEAEFPYPAQAAPAPPQVAARSVGRGFPRDSAPESTGAKPTAEDLDRAVGRRFIRGNSAAGYVGALAPEVRSLTPAPAQPQVVHILDDGFQHRQLHRDIDILLLNRADWHDRLLPAGNLREALRAATRASIIAIPATEPDLESQLHVWGWKGPIWRLNRRLEIPSINAQVLAFCGIARPEQFFAGLTQSALELTAHYAFRDHHRYTVRDLDRLANQARAAGATTLLTTEKDEVRLQGLKSPLPIATVRLRTEIENEPAALDWIAAQLR